MDSVRLHVNGQRENGDLSIATAGAEISTVVIVEQDGADSAEPSRQPVHEKGHLDLPSSRKLSFRRSRKTRRNIPPSNGAVVEIVVQEYEEDTEVVEQATLASNEDKAEEEAENNALPLQDRLQKQRYISVLWVGVQCTCVRTWILCIDALLLVHECVSQRMCECMYVYVSMMYMCMRMCIYAYVYMHDVYVCVYV